MGVEENGVMESYLLRAPDRACKWFCARNFGFGFTTPPLLLQLVPVALTQPRSVSRTALVRRGQAAEEAVAFTSGPSGEI